MITKFESFAEKKFVIIVADQISARDLAYTASLIGFQFGRKVPTMVGRDQQIPGGGASRKHLGITTQNLPVLNGLSFEKMRAIRASLIAEKELMVTSVLDAVGACATYNEYAQKVKTIPESSANYWGIGIFGNAAIINKYTQGLKLYGKQPKIPHSNTTTPEKRLIESKSDLPTIRLILANNLSGGELANTATILGVTFGKLYSDKIFGSDVTDYAGLSLGLPMVDLAILNGHPSSNVTMRKLRDTLHNESNLSVVDVTDATGKTRSYEDYLAIAEKTAVLDTVYWGLGISGPSELVSKYTSELSPYITSAEEQALIKKEEAAKKWQAKKTAAPAKNEATKLGEIAANGGLLQQRNVPPVASQSDDNKVVIDSDNSNRP